MTIISPIFGFGNTSFGNSIFGYGTPATSVSQLNQPMNNLSQSASLDARLIDTNTRDYVINADGNTAGMSSVSQQVFLAMSTTFGSASVTSIGNTIKSMQVLNSSYQQTINTIVQQALSALVTAGTISIVNIQVSPLTFQGTVTGAIVNLTWIDNTTTVLTQSNYNVSGM